MDMVAASFIRTAQDVQAVKNRVSEHRSDAWIIAKLEKPQAIEHLEEILDISDGVMVARGDLGVEMPPEKVPIIQKHIIRRAADWRKPVITATQMLESMVENPRPTRAEASDVANAVLDGTDALMLSAETATGKYPREAVSIMSRIILEAESHMQENPLRRRQHRRLSISETVCESVAHAAQDLDMRAIAVYTETGTTARLISKYRPQCGIYALSSTRVCSRMNLMWGVLPVLSEVHDGTEDMVIFAEKVLLKKNAVQIGDVVAVVAGTQSATGSTNFMRLHVVGDSEPAPPSKDSRKSQRIKPVSSLEGRKL